MQRNLVAAYKGLQRLAEENEILIAQLNEAFQALIANCQRRYHEVKLGDYEAVEDRNTERKDYPFCGVNKGKVFMPTAADTNNLDSKKYKLVRQNAFAFSGMQTGRDVCVRIAFHAQSNMLLVSPAYCTFRVKNGSNILPQFLYMQFIRPEMDRLGWFLSEESIRPNLG